jgi:purple acid phosphatase-like protein
MKKFFLTLTALSGIFLFSLNLVWAASVPAFPGAEGFGAKTVGGRGGRVIEVTNLNDSGAGSFRAAVNTTGPRIIVFRTGGTITLLNNLDITSPFIYIAGQSAPGDGLQIKGGFLKVATHDVIIRYMKFRPGDYLAANATGTDGLFIDGTKGLNTYNIIVDHCTIVWGPDTGGISMSVNVHDVTVQDCIEGEGLYLSHHLEGTVASGGHSKGSVLSDLQQAYGTDYPTNITLLRNLLTTSDDRNFSLQQTIGMEIVNIVIYNWGKHATFGNVQSLNLIKNFYIEGPETSYHVCYKPTVKAGETLHLNAVYESGNQIEGSATIRGDPQTVYASTRFSQYTLASELTPQQAYDRIVGSGGASFPIRDSCDLRIINNLKNRTGVFLNGVDSPAPSIGSLWPTLAAGTPPVDSDHDGMPDTWEIQRGLNPNVDDSAADRDGDGYTNIEEYINGLTSAPPTDSTPPVISGVGASLITASAAAINWTTNEVADSQVEYGTTTAYGSSTTLNTSLVTSHSEALSGLVASSLYHYRVKSRDAAGNLATSGDLTFTTSSTRDITPPTISAVTSSNVTTNSATITWNTDENSDSQVEYGPSTSYGSVSNLFPTLAKTHSLNLTSLNAGQTYYYRVKSKDAAGNLATSSANTFATANVADITPPSPVTILSVSTTG